MPPIWAGTSLQSKDGSLSFLTAWSLDVGMEPQQPHGSPMGASRPVGLWDASPRPGPCSLRLGLGRCKGHPAGLRCLWERRRPALGGHFAPAFYLTHGARWPHFLFFEFHMHSQTILEPAPLGNRGFLLPEEARRVTSTPAGPGHLSLWPSVHTGVWL